MAATTMSMPNILLLLLWFNGGGLLGSSHVVPLPADPVVAQIAPTECAFYASWTATTPAVPGASSSTERLFADSKFLDYLQHTKARLHESFVEGIASLGLSEQQVAGLMVLFEHLHTHAGTCYLATVEARRSHPVEIRGGLVVRVDDDDHDRFVSACTALLQLVPQSSQSTIQVGNDSFSQIQSSDGSQLLAWGIRENYFIAGIGADEVEQIVQRFGGPVPAWLTAAEQRVAVPRPARFVHLDIQGLFSVIGSLFEPPDVAIIAGALRAFGLERVESFSCSSGLDEHGTVSQGLLAISSPLRRSNTSNGSSMPRGILALLDCEPLVASDFHDISSSSPLALVFQFNFVDGLTALFDCCDHELAPPGASAAARRVRLQLEMIRHALGVDLLNDLLASVGDTWRIFVQPGPEALLEGWTVSVDLADANKFAKLHDKLLADFRKRTENHGPVKIVTQQNQRAAFHSVQIEGAPVTPSWSIYGGHLSIASSAAAVDRLLTAAAPADNLAMTDHIRPHLADGRRTIKLLKIDMIPLLKLAVPLLAAQLDSLPAGEPIDASLVPPIEIVTACLQPMLFAVERTDTGVTFTHHGNVPSMNVSPMIPLLAFAALHNVELAREEDRLGESRNNQKRIALALLNFESANGVFPAGYSADARGRPLLSWRVHILPYLDEQRLYQQFHLNEPWDSPHNRRLIRQIPTAYRSPRSDVDRGKTTYLGISGADGVFVRPQDGSHLGIGLRQVTDGTANTVMTVESTDQRALIWTRPGDFGPQLKNPQHGLRRDRRHGLSLGFADGSVRSVAHEIADATLNALFTKSGGEVVEPP